MKSKKDKKKSKVTIKYFLNKNLNATYFEGLSETKLFYPLYILLTYKRKHYKLKSRFFKFIDNIELNNDLLVNDDLLVQNYYTVDCNVLECEETELIFNEINTGGNIEIIDIKYHLKNMLICEVEHIMGLFHNFPEVRIDNFGDYYDSKLFFIFDQIEFHLMDECNRIFNNFFGSELDFKIKFNWDRYNSNLIDFIKHSKFSAHFLQKDEILESLEGINELHKLVRHHCITKYGFGHKGITLSNWGTLYADLSNVIDDSILSFELKSLAKEIFYSVDFYFSIEG